MLLLDLAVLHIEEEVALQTEQAAKCIMPLYGELSQQFIN